MGGGAWPHPPAAPRAPRTEPRPRPGAGTAGAQQRGGRLGADASRGPAGAPDPRVLKHEREGREVGRGGWRAEKKLAGMAGWFEWLANNKIIHLKNEGEGRTRHPPKTTHKTLPKMLLGIRVLIVFYVLAVFMPVWLIGLKYVFKWSAFFLARILVFRSAPAQNNSPPQAPCAGAAGPGLGGWFGGGGEGGGVVWGRTRRTAGPACVVPKFTV